jgi:hypothetical protein
VTSIRLAVFQDGDPCACYALIDLGEIAKSEFRRFENTVEEVAEEIINQKPSRKLCAPLEINFVYINPFNTVT